MSTTPKTTGPFFVARNTKTGDTYVSLRGKTAYNPPEDYEISEVYMVSKEDLDDLLSDSTWLQCLEAAGVDNWQGISYAHELRGDEE